MCRYRVFFLSPVSDSPVQTLSNPALEALSNMTEAERCVFIKVRHTSERAQEALALWAVKLTAIEQFCERSML